MARLYRTPDVLHDLTRFSKLHDENGNLLPEVNKESTEVRNVEYKLLKTLDKMIAENADLTQTQLMKRANTYGETRRRYDYIFKDLIEMLNKYALGKIPKDEDEKYIPNFDTLAVETRQKTKRFIMGTFDELTFIFDAPKYSALADKVAAASDAYIAFEAGDFRIHPDFAGLSINEIFDKISDKYETIQKLRKEYEMLKLQVEKSTVSTRDN